MGLPATYSKTQLIQYGFSEGRWNPGKHCWEVAVQGSWKPLSHFNEHFSGDNYKYDPSHYRGNL